MRQYFIWLNIAAVLLLFALPVKLVQSAPDPRVQLTAEEIEFLDNLGEITMCVDPDWPPYEVVDEDGSFSGIAADLIDIVSERLGVPFVIIPTADWAETLECSQAGKCHLIPFLNQTAAREEWLIFTEPLFVDPNVFVTREEHPYISNPADLVDKTIVLPYGTSIEEWTRRDFPNLTVINTDDEIEAFRLVERGEADMTLRSLMIAAYTIREQGFFNLKISGEVPEYTNNLRMGVLKDEVMLRDILSKAILTITPQEREEIINRHVYIKMDSPVNYQLIVGTGVSVALLFLSLFSVLLYRERRKLASDLVERTRELAESESRYRNLSIKDSLTGLYNRRHFDEVLNIEWNRAKRNSHPLSLLILDLDFFKSYNDNYGHLEGDKVLRAVADQLKLTLKRSTDFIVRYGGEEFCIVLPETSAEKALQAGKMIKQAIDSLKIEHNYSTVSGYLTVSIGVASKVPHQDFSAMKLLELADQALYEAKESGRNRVILKENSN